MLISLSEPPKAIHKIVYNSIPLSSKILPILHSLWAQPGRGPQGCSRPRAGPLLTRPRRPPPSRPCWSWRWEGPRPGPAAAPAWGWGGSTRRRRPEGGAWPPGWHGQQMSGFQEAEGWKKKSASIRTLSTDPDVLRLVAVHQLTLQHFQTLCGQRCRALQHLGIEQQPRVKNEVILSTLCVQQPWEIRSSHNYVTNAFSGALNLVR